VLEQEVVCKNEEHLLGWISLVVML